MIQEYFHDECATAFPELDWSIDWYEGDENKGVVYAEDADPPDLYESGLRFPYYMIFIRSKDWYRAEQIAHAVFDLFNKRHKITFTNTSDIVYDIIFIEASSDVNRLGVKDGYMEYTVNFKVTLKK